MFTFPGDTVPSGMQKRFFRRLVSALILLWFLSGCQARLPQFRSALQDQGELYIYVQPFPQEADRLRFSLQGLSAVKDDGSEFPIPLSFAEFRGVEMKRQRLLGSGELPPGDYKGLAFQVRDAFLRGEEEDAALLVPEQPVRIDFPFHVGRKKSSLLLLVFNYGESVRERFGFYPGFSVFVPERPVTGLVGYVANCGSNNITVFDKKAMQVVGVMATGTDPRGMALDQRNRRAFVALSGDDTLEAIDVTSGTVTSRVRLSTGDHPQEPALTTDGLLLLTANSGSNTVSLVDPVSLIELGRVAVGDGPQSVLVDRAGKRAYVFNAQSGTVSVIDLAVRSLAATLSVGPVPVRGAFNRAGDRLYVIHEGSPYLTVIDPLALSVLQRVFVGAGMTALKVDTNTDLLYIGKKFDPGVEIYDPFSLFPVDSIRAGRDIAHMAIDGEENNLYLVLPGTRRVAVFSLLSKKMVSEIDVGEGACWVTLMGERW